MDSSSGLMWERLLSAPFDSSIAALAMKQLEGAERLSPDEASARQLSYPLIYMLNKAPSAGEKEQLCGRFQHARSPSLRMVVAEDVARRNPEMGLRMMAAILPDIGFDHDTADSIAMWMGEKGTGALKRSFLEEAGEHRERGDDKTAGSYEWAASMIP